MTPLTWQTVLAIALPHMGPYARAVAPANPNRAACAPSAAAAPAGTPEAERGSRMAVEAAEKVEEERVALGRALKRARRSLLSQEYYTLPLREKAHLLEVSWGVGGVV